MSYVYILKSLKNSEYYIGSSSNPDRRLTDHNSGKVKATKYKAPYIEVFRQKFDNEGIARKMESKLKSWKRRDFIDKIIQDGKITVKP